MFDFAGIPRDLDAITPTQKASGAAGHHAHRADHFVRQCQRHYQERHQQLWLIHLDDPKIAHYLAERFHRFRVGGGAVGGNRPL
jgi:hypothetical protein